MGPLTEQASRSSSMNISSTLNATQASHPCRPQRKGTAKTAIPSASLFTINVVVRR